MLIRELLENNSPGQYVYHASYLPDQTAGLKSILTKGLQPSKEGYGGSGVYFAYDPEGGYYHVSKEEATMFRVKWSTLVSKFGVYPNNQNGIERDANEIIVPGAVPADMLEVEYFPGEWWDLKSAYHASLGPVDEAEEPMRIKLGGNSEAAKAWIKRVYARYPQTMQNNHVMTWGSGDDLQFAMFELTPSFSNRGAVEVKWIQAYPLRAGVGSRAMKELQALAREDGISLTLFPWDKGQVSQSKLTKFYKGQGFAPSVKGGKAMQWSPELAEGVESLDYQGNCTEDEVVDEIFGDVNNFARMVEEHGDEFTVGKLVVKYDPETDIHSFYYKKSGVAEGLDPNMWPTNLRIGRYLDHHSVEFKDATDYADVTDLIENVEDLIDGGTKPQVVTVNPEQLFATQDWLSNYGSDGSMFDEYSDLPVVYKKGNEAYILDGHHRVAKALKSHTPIKVYLFV